MTWFYFYMPDIEIRTDDYLLHKRLERLADKLRSNGYEVFVADPPKARETRDGWLGSGSPAKLTDVVLVLTSVILTKEYEEIKRFFKEWFTQEEIVRGVPVRVKRQEDRKIVDTFWLSEGQEGDHSDVDQPK